MDDAQAISSGCERETDARGPIDTEARGSVLPRTREARAELYRNPGTGVNAGSGGVFQGRQGSRGEAGGSAAGLETVAAGPDSLFLPRPMGIIGLSA